MTRQRLFSTTGRPRSALAGARLLGVTLLALALTAALATTAATPALAGSNSGVNGCLRGYNYADASSNYLFASSDALASDCDWLSVDISNNGNLGSSGFAYSWCSGTVLSYREGYGYVSTSTTVSSSTWSSPCSNHVGAPWQYAIHKWGALNFVY